MSKTQSVSRSHVREAILAMAATAFGVSLAACGGSANEPKAPVAASEVPAASSTTPKEHSCSGGSCSGKKEASCSGKKEGSCSGKKEASCSGKKEGSCSAKKDETATAPAAVTTDAKSTDPKSTDPKSATPAKADGKGATPATPADPKAAGGKTSAVPATPAKPAAKAGSSEAGCGAGSCSAKKKK